MRYLFAHVALWTFCQVQKNQRSEASVLKGRKLYVSDEGNNHMVFRYCVHKTRNISFTVIRYKYMLRPQYMNIMYFGHEFKWDILPLMHMIKVTRKLFQEQGLLGLDLLKQQVLCHLGNSVVCFQELLL
jgi:hypothetical protein